MKRPILALVLPLMLILLGCEGAISPTAPDETPVAQQPATGVGAVSSVGATSAASAPVPFPVFDEFPGVNPCTGEGHIITLTGTAWWHFNRNNIVIRLDRTITTSDGFEGRGYETEVGNFSGANVYKATFNDMLTHPSGARIRTHFVYVLDFSTDTLYVERFSASCVPS